MDKNKFRWGVDIITICVSGLAILTILPQIVKNDDIIKYVVIVVSMVAASGILTSICSLIKHWHSRTEKYDRDVMKLNKIVQYDKKRREIEEEMDRLISELTKSDVSRYIDVNRLVFSGQSGRSTSGPSDAFLDQFGLDRSSVDVKENHAVFLAPFNVEGTRLFERCQAILGKADIFLQKTDNLVEKNDILMNIVTLIVRSELVIASVDGRNPNVYYELGLAHALGKPTILLSNAEHSLEDVGFDVRQKMIIVYHDDKELETELLYQLNRLKKF